LRSIPIVVAVVLLATPATARDKGDFSMLAGGDFAFPAGKWDREIEAIGPAFLDGIRPLLDDSDVRFLNLEAAVTDRPFAVAKEYQYRMPAARLRWAIDGGFNLISLANNHMGDAGEGGVADTEAALRSVAGERKVAWAGAGSRLDGDVLEGTWGRVSFVAISCTRYGQVAKPGPAVLRRIRAAREDGDTVVVSAHCGTEYRHEPPRDVVALYRSLVDAGADVVIGHHPHVVQGVEVRGRGVILYSLGNLALASLTRRHLETGARMYGLLAHVEFEGGRPARVRLLPTWASNSDPLVAEGDRLAPTPFRPLRIRGALARRALAELAEFSKAIPGNATRIAVRDDEGFVEIGGAR
jgi:poly-gamma-glutamate synthesis protein (capsule biosynthesis protein)